MFSLLHTLTTLLLLGAFSSIERESIKLALAGQQFTADNYTFDVFNTFFYLDSPLATKNNVILEIPFANKFYYVFFNSNLNKFVDRT